MEGLAYTHLSMAYEEANLNPCDDEVTLFKGSQWQPPSSGWISVLSSIMMISILSLADSSFAFSARVRYNLLDSQNNKKLGASVCFLPEEQVGIINTRGGTVVNCLTSGQLPGVTPKVELKPQTEVNILFCREDEWCYMTSYEKYIPSPTGRVEKVKIAFPRWVLKQDFCDLYQGEKPLEDCKSQDLFERTANKLNSKEESNFKGWW